MGVNVVSGPPRMIHVSGGLDFSSTAQLNRAVDDAISESPHGFIIDLIEVSYIDSVGIASIVRAHQQLAVAGGRLAVAASGQIKRMIGLILPRSLPGLVVSDDLESAAKVLAEAAGKTV